MLTYRDAGLLYGTVQDEGLTLEETLQDDGVYSMLGDNSPTDRLIVVRSSAGVVAVWASKGALIVLDTQMYGQRRFRKTRERPVLGFEAHTTGA